MSKPGEWIDFEELCRRVPGKSPRTMRRYAAKRLISFRQLGGRGGRLEFNWQTVAGELRALESGGVNAPQPSAVASPDDLAAIRCQLGELLGLVRAIADKLGVK